MPNMLLFAILMFVHCQALMIVGRGPSTLETRTEQSIISLSARPSSSGSHAFPLLPRAESETSQAVKKGASSFPEEEAGADHDEKGNAVSPTSGRLQLRKRAVCVADEKYFTSNRFQDPRFLDVGAMPGSRAQAAPFLFSPEAIGVAHPGESDIVVVVVDRRGAIVVNLRGRDMARSESQIQARPRVTNSELPLDIVQRGMVSARHQLMYQPAAL